MREPQCVERATMIPRFLYVFGQDSGRHKESDMNALHNANIQESSSSESSLIVLPKANSSKAGVSVEYVPHPDKHWYVLRILYGRTQQAQDALIGDGHYAYVAMIWKDQVKDGKRHRVLMPFLNLVFAYITPEQADKYVKASPESRFITYYYNHFELDHRGLNPPLTISDHDIQLIIRATAVCDQHVMEVDLKKVHFTSDDLVRVTDGPFKDITGRVARVARQNRVVIHIKGLSTGITTAYIPPCYLEKIEQN